MLLALVIAAPVVLRVEETVNLPSERATEVLAEVVSAVKRNTGLEVAVDDFTQCTDERDCVEDVAARFGAKQVVLLKLAGALNTGRAVVLLASPDQGVQRRVEIDFPLDDQRDWPALFGAVATILFPQSVPPKVQVALPPPPPIVEESKVGSIVSWTAIGVGVALSGGAIGLRVSSENLRDDAEALDFEDPSRPGLESRSNRHGLASNLMFGAGAVAIASGVVYLLTR